MEEITQLGEEAKERAKKIEIAIQTQEEYKKTGERK